MLNAPPLDSSTVDPERSPRLNPHYRLQWEEAQQSFVLLYPEGMVKLNQSAGEVLSQCDGNATITAIIEELSVRFPEATTLHADVLEFVGDALERRWLIL